MRGSATFLLLLLLVFAVGLVCVCTQAHADEPAPVQVPAPDQIQIRYLERVRLDFASRPVVRGTQCRWIPWPSNQIHIKCTIYDGDLTCRASGFAICLKSGGAK